MREWVLNMSGVYQQENFRPEGAVNIDLTDIPGTVCYCDDDAASELRRRLSDCPSNALHWIDSGDYHYLTLFFLEKIDRPFRLLLLDNHSDDFISPQLSCGSWVREARSLPNFRDTDDPSIPVYISIDKDVLSRDHARTNWDQGTMSLDELLEALRVTASRSEVIGVDVCGEISESKGACGNDFEINLRTNEILREYLLFLVK